MQLSRFGTAFTASYSYDGTNCMAIGAPVTLLSAAVTEDAGIISTSHDVAQSAINQFDSVAIGH